MHCREREIPWGIFKSYLRKLKLTRGPGVVVNIFRYQQFLKEDCDTTQWCHNATQSYKENWYVDPQVHASGQCHCWKCTILWDSMEVSTLLVVSETEILRFQHSEMTNIHTSSHSNTSLLNADRNRLISVSSWSRTGAHFLTDFYPVWKT